MAKSNLDDEVLKQDLATLISLAKEHGKDSEEVQTYVKMTPDDTDYGRKFWNLAPSVILLGIGDEEFCGYICKEEPEFANELIKNLHLKKYLK